MTGYLALGLIGAWLLAALVLQPSPPSQSGN
jgi:hypothetical protein